AGEIRFLIRGVVDDSIPRYQVSAWLMAVFLQGMRPAELQALTEALIHSGQTVDLSHLDGFKVDKHSTGGVGDKTSPILAPIVAAAGAFVPMVSGRGLGHTGGTLDKLESIPGFRVDLDLEAFGRVTERAGFCLIGQTRQFNPGDRILYSLRDVTATVESIPLIVSSIISKKVAEGIDGLVLDVKTGRGAFMKTMQDSERLARALVEAGTRLGKKTVALITDMSQPLGRMVGNSLEMIECFETLKGQGPQDLTSLSLELAAHMLHMAGRAEGLDSARRLARRQIRNGKALHKLGQLIEAQGGNPEVLSDYSLLGRSKAVSEYAAPRSGFVQAAHADLIGEAAMLLGAGRRRAEDRINPVVGIELLKKVGDSVQAGEAVARIHHDSQASKDQALGKLQEAFEIADHRADPPPLVRRVIG
ncbi:MAG: thymidine phosphorylase, partial [Acidobacteriota bacterium]